MNLKQIYDYLVTKDDDFLKQSGKLLIDLGDGEYLEVSENKPDFTEPAFGSFVVEEGDD